MSDLMPLSARKYAEIKLHISNVARYSAGG